VSRQADGANKGTAMGIYSSSQFLGIFAGGALAGITFQYAGSIGIFIFNSVISLLWTLIAAFMNPDAYELTLTIPLPHQEIDNTDLQQALNQLAGVKSVSISHEEQKIYLRIAKNTYVKNSAEECIRNAVGL
jgi:MFS family permease